MTAAALQAARRPTEPPLDGAGYELHFGSLFVEGRGLSFPCDAQGRVELSALSLRAQHNYQLAVAVVGREYRVPAVRRSDHH